MADKRNKGKEVMEDQGGGRIQPKREGGEGHKMGKHSGDSNNTFGFIPNEAFRPELAMPHFKERRGIVSFKIHELLPEEKKKRFALLGCFDGRFPGMKAIIGKVRTWKERCRVIEKPNGFILLTFQNALDRDSILNGKDTYLFGKKLYLRLLEEDFELMSDEFRRKPVWIKLPRLPGPFWDHQVLARIASSIGKPIKMDSHTYDRTRMRFAKFLVELDTSKKPISSMILEIEGRRPHTQVIEYTQTPSYCPVCAYVDHVAQDCPKRLARINGELLPRWTAKEGKTVQEGVEEGRQEKENI